MPWSDRSVAGNAVLENICYKAWAMHLAEMDLTGMASGHRVAMHTYVKIYRTPPLPLGNGQMSLLTMGAFLGFNLL